MTRQEAIPTIALAAAKIELELGCPAEVLFAQTAVESDWLNNAPGNNCLGYKDYEGSFGRQLLKTLEWFTIPQKAAFLALGDGRQVTQTLIRGSSDSSPSQYEVLDWFATFPSIEACMAKRAARWRAGANLAWVKAYSSGGDLPTLFLNIALSGYATSNATIYSKACMAALDEPGARDAITSARSQVRTDVA